MKIVYDLYNALAETKYIARKLDLWQKLFDEISKRLIIDEMNTFLVLYSPSDI